MSLIRVREYIEFWELENMDEIDRGGLEMLAEDDVPAGKHRILTSVSFLNSLIKLGGAVQTKEFWLVGSIKNDMKPAEQEFQGLFDSEEKAAAACNCKPNWFIAPLKLNETMPDETTAWAGLYYPEIEKRLSKNKNESEVK